MGLEDDKRKLEAKLSSVLHWVDKQLKSPYAAEDKSFLETVRKYSLSGLRRLSEAKRPADLGDIQRRLEKVQNAVILYVQRRIGRRNI